MNSLQRLLQLIGLKSIKKQLLLLNAILVLSGFSAMGIIYDGMQADAATINTAGRQRMLSQRVAKEALLVHFGQQQPSSVKQTMALFESSHQMLLNGDAEQGVSPPMTLEIKDQLLQVESMWKEYSEYIKAFISGGYKDSDAGHLQQIEEIARRSPKILKEMNRAVEMMELASNTNVATNIRSTLGLILMLMLLSGVLFLYVNKHLMQPLLPLRSVLNMVAKGDLTQDLPADSSGDEMGSLYTDYNHSRGEFSTMLSEVVSAIEQISTASLQLKVSANQNATGMDQQYQEVEMISTAMTEMTATIQEVAGSSANASEYTGRADQDAIGGRQVMNEAATTIQQLNKQVESVSDVIHTLNTDSKEINTVLDVINGIAEQTNLLALNAAIEAARAGEAGRGFAVVADEVRGLATRTAQSTKEIQRMIESLQSQAQTAVIAIQSGREQADRGVVKVQEADAALERITEAVVSINEMNAHIATASREQSQVAEDMNQRIVQVATVAQDTRSNAMNNRELAENLSSMGEQLRQEMASFRY